MTLDELFPNLKSADYQVTSPATPVYNCIAWAVGDDHIRWDFAPGYYWPRRIPRDGFLGSVIQLFRSLGFQPCIGGDLEPNVQKVALYATKGVFTHAARQTPDGRWTSKIGTLEDIEHESLDALEGEEYGYVAQFLSRHT